MIIKDCPVTKSNAVIVNQYSENHTGVDIETDIVYSASNGCVLYVGSAENNTKTVTVSILDSNCCFNYKNLLDCQVKPGDSVTTDYVIGHARKYVHVEFADFIHSRFPLRIGRTTYYKHDPTDKLSGVYVPTDLYVKDIQYNLSKPTYV